MPSPAQIKARKAFVKNYAKKGKKKKPVKAKAMSKLKRLKREKLFEQQREPTRAEFKKAGYTKAEIDDYFYRKENRHRL